MVNYPAIIVAALAAMGIGAFWYSPAGFGKIWMELMGLNVKDMEKAKKKGIAKSYFANFVALIIMSYILSIFVNEGGFSAGLSTGFLAWLGFVVTVALGGLFILSNQDKNK